MLLFAVSQASWICFHMQNSNHFHCCNTVWLTNTITHVGHCSSHRHSLPTPNFQFLTIQWTVIELHDPGFPTHASAAVVVVMQWLLMGWRVRDEPNVTEWPRERGAPCPLLSAPPHGPAPHQACPKCTATQRGQHREGWGVAGDHLGSTAPMCGPVPAVTNSQLCHWGYCNHYS